MIADRIKALRESRGLTQSELARMLNVSRSSINAWEIGISAPSTSHLKELSDIFKVSSDHILEIKTTAAINAEGLTDEDIEMVTKLVAYLREKNQGQAVHNQVSL